ncbi:uncharacterized protein LOC114340473 [Diabrotica virgifera virgifera]|uniref:Uncharacterized protein n=1 Tax=Diabrotica virgifera virgifera TaxID=50390 RepID=A0ABM5KZ58_DIAVI|nr:uncharacterized protein LOC114340473 [Diabrotica virgifera virgifera]
MELISKDNLEHINNNYWETYPYIRVSTPILKRKVKLVDTDSQYIKFCEHLHEPPIKTIVRGLQAHKSDLTAGHIILNRQKSKINSEENEIKKSYEDNNSINIYLKSDVVEIIINPTANSTEKETVSIHEKLKDMIQGEIFANRSKYSRKWRKIIDNSKSKWLRILDIFRKEKSVSTLVQYQNKGRYFKYADEICF